MKGTAMNPDAHEALAYFIKVRRDVLPSSPESSNSSEDNYEDPYSDTERSDFVSSDEEPKRQKTTPKSEPGRSTKAIYIEMCQTQKIVPLREVCKQFGNNILCLRRSILGHKDVKAISTALLRDVYCRVLDLSGIFMEMKTVQYISMMLIENSVITELNIADNQLSGPGIRCLAEAVKENGIIRTLNVSGNGLRDGDSVYIADIISNATSIQRLNLSHNELREDAGKIIGTAIAENKNLKELDLSWNHIRCRGAIEIAKSLQKNTGLVTVKLGWNGFAYGGAVALGEALEKNTTLLDLDLSCNRIHPPALLQFLKGFTKNKTLIKLNLSDNPITVPFAGVILASIRDSPHMALTYLDLNGIVVDEEFLKILNVLESTRMFEVRYETALPLNTFSRNKSLKQFGKKDDVFTLDPIEMLYTLKEKMRAIDFFSKLDKGKTNTVSKAELHKLFKESGIPVTSASVDKAMDFLDYKRDGFIDLEEFLEADKKIKRYSRAKAAKRAATQAKLSTEKENRYSQSYRGAEFNETTGKVELDVDREANAMVNAVMTPEDSLSVLENRPSPNLRNGLLKPLTDRRRTSVATLYGVNRRSSLGGNSLLDWPINGDYE